MSDVKRHGVGGELMGWVWCAWGAVLAGVVVLPVMLPMVTVLYWDVDPRSAMGGETGALLGPRGMAWLQVVQMAVAVLGGAAAVWSGVKVRWVSLGLAGVGLVWCAGHMLGLLGDGAWEDLLYCGSWAAAVAMAVGALHLAQRPGARRWMVAVLLATLVPLTAQAVWQVTIDHSMNVEFYETNKEMLLQARGIEEGSMQHELFERRLMFPDATGSFGLSNILGSIAAALAVLGIGVGVGGVLGRRGEELEEGEKDHEKAIRGFGAALLSPRLKGGNWAGLVVGVMGLVAVYVTHSKGAAVAVVIGLGVLGAGVLVRGWLERKASGAWALRYSALGLGLIALGVVGVAILAVMVRGWMGAPLPEPEGPGAAGERSLLFRWQYAWAAAQIWASSAGALIGGVGPEGFTRGYLWAKDPLNPETVVSTHNVLVDWVVMLGVGGLAWSAMVLGWLWNSGKGVLSGLVVQEEAEGDGGAIRGFAAAPLSPRLQGEGAKWLAVVVGVLVFAVVFGVRLQEMWLGSVLMWLGAGVCFMVVAGLVGWLAEARSVGLGLYAAATVVVVHGQVEMTFFQPSSAGLVLFMVAIAGAFEMPSLKAKTETKADEAKAAALVKGGGLVVAGLLVVCGLVFVAQVSEHESAAESAAAAMSPSRGDMPKVMDELERMQEAAGFDERAMRWRVQLHAMEPMRPLVEHGRSDLAEARVDEALTWLDTALGDGDMAVSGVRLKANLQTSAAEVLSQPERLKDAIEAHELLQTLTPYNIRDTLALADLYAQTGQTEKAQQAYTKVLRLRDEQYLDPADPLTPQDLTRVQQAL